MLLSEIKDVIGGRCVTFDADDKGEHWVTIKKDPDGKGRKVLLNKNGNIIGGDVPKQFQGKHISKYGSSEEHKDVSKKEKQEEPIHATSNHPSSKIREHLQSEVEKIQQEIEKANTGIRDAEKMINDAAEQFRKERGENYSWKELSNVEGFKKGWALKEKIQEEHKILHERRKNVFLDLMRQPEENRIKCSIFSDPSIEKEKKWAAKELESLLQYIHRSSFSSSSSDKPSILQSLEKPGHINIGLEFRPGRAYCAGNTIVLGAKKASVLQHEFGHVIEHKNSRVLNKCRRWRDSRTVGELSQKMSEATKISAYDPHEKTKKDKFFHPYVGKMYAGGSTEVLSMGLEAIMKDPVGFAKKDQEHFDLIVDIMRGRI